MRLFITAKPRAKKEGVEKTGENKFLVAVKEPPIQGRANAAIIKSLADYLNIDPWRFKIISGHTSRQKIVEILD